MVRVALVSSIRAVRAGLRALLNEAASIEVWAEAARLDDPHALPVGTDVLVIAAEAASEQDLRQALALAEAPPAVLLLVEEPADTRSLPGLPARAWGVLPLDSTPGELAAAIHALHEGLWVGSAALVAPLFGERLASEEGPVEPLTERETQVLQLLAQGLANKQIAFALGISEHTVKFHVSSIYSKLGAANRTEAVRRGVQSGLVLL